MTFVTQRCRYLTLLIIFMLNACGYKDSLYVPEEAETNQQSEAPEDPANTTEKGK